MNRYPSVEVRGGWVWDHLYRSAFYLYAFLGAPILARQLTVALHGGERAVLPAMILLAAVFLEAPGLYWKVLFTRRRAVEEGIVQEGSMLAAFMAAGIGHMMVTIFIGMTALDALGGLGDGSTASPAWLAFTVILLFFKEMALFIFTAGGRAAAQPSGHWKERAGDLLLLLFGCVAYTVWWDVLINVGEAGESGLHWAVLLFLTPFLGLLFLILYLPLRLGFLLEEYFLRPAAGRKRRLLVDLGVGLLLGLYPLFF